MDQSSTGARIPGGAHAAAVGRWLTAIVLSGVVAGVGFLIVVENAHDRGYTDVTFNHSLGVLIGGAGTQARSSAALGVTGDSAAPTGLMWGAVISLLVMALHSLIVWRFAHRRWYVQALPLAVLVFVLVMALYLPLIDRSQVVDVQVGALGLDAGGATPVVFALGAVAYGLLGARVYSLGVSTGWWEVREAHTEKMLSEIPLLGELGIVPDEPVDPERPLGTGTLVTPGEPDGPDASDTPDTPDGSTRR